jgi:signal transduction histidine kinase/ActR/RegA family two-component response regulator
MSALGAGFLAEIGTLLASSLDYEETLQRLARHCVPVLADLCVIDVLDEGGAIRRVAAAHARPGQEARAAEVRRFAPDPDGAHPVARVLRTGAPDVAGRISDETLACIAPHPDHRRVADALGYTSYIVVPMIARGRTLGTISLVACESGRSYDAGDLAVAEELARRAALSADNARLFAESERRRREAEALTAVGRMLAQVLDVDVASRCIADTVRELFQARTSVVFRLDADSGDLVALAVSGELGPAFAGQFVFPAGAGTVGLALRLRAPVVTADNLDDPRLVMPDALRARMVQAPHRSVLAVPLLLKDGVIGALGIGDGAGRVFTAREVRLAESFADQAAVALENARLFAVEAARRRQMEALVAVERELRESEQAARASAEAANRAKDEFLATLSHELRTPLTAILGWARLMTTEMLDPAAARRAAEVIERNALMQAQLIDDLLDVSRIISGKLHIDMQRVDLVPVMEAALDAVRAAAHAKGIQLHLVLDAAAGPVAGDAARLQQVVWNLLSNAIKFTPAGGRVEVRLERAAAGRARLVVSDSGEGIAPGFLPHVFERFRQAEGSGARRHGGLGLGLAIVRHLVERHGGTVRADSPGPGQGATFSVELPVLDLVSAEAGARGPAAPVARAMADLGGIGILVVDDDEDARSLTTAVLRGCGAAVTAVASVAEALAAIERLRPAVLVADLAMPGRDGFDLIDEVRRLPRGRGGATLAIALSAYASLEDRRRALAAGFDVHLSKPFEPAELAAVVARLSRQTAA